MTEHLKPCPFCGGTATLEDDRLAWVVRCSSCGVCVIGERAPEPEGKLPDSYWEPFRRSAIDRWNRRTALAQPEAHDITLIPCDETTPMKTVERNGIEHLVPEKWRAESVAMKPDGTFHLNLIRTAPKPVPAAQPEAEKIAIGPEWQPCVKLPITVHVREQRPGETHVSTREGITPIRADDLIMRGVQGEEYPIGRELFNKTYKMGKDQPEAMGPSDEELLELMPETMDDEFDHAAATCSTATGGRVVPGIFRVCLNHSALEYARAVLARWGRPLPTDTP